MISSRPISDSGALGDEIWNFSSYNLDKMLNFELML